MSVCEHGPDGPPQQLLTGRCRVPAAGRDGRTASDAAAAVVGRLMMQQLLGYSNSPPADCSGQRF